MTIISGVSIGDGAVVGANALVNRDVPPYSIVGGVPAKILGYRFDRSTVEALLKLNWWSWPIEKIIENKSLFTGPLDITKISDELGGQ